MREVTGRKLEAMKLLEKIARGPLTAAKSTRRRGAPGVRLLAR